MEKNIDKLQSAGIASRLPAVLQRRSDKRTYKDALYIFNGRENEATKLQMLSKLLRENETVNDIVMETFRGKGGSATTVTADTAVSMSNRARILCSTGAPADCVTFASVVTQHEAAEREYEERRELLKRQRDVAREERERGQKSPTLETFRRRVVRKEEREKREAANEQAKILKKKAKEFEKYLALEAGKLLKHREVTSSVNEERVKRAKSSSWILSICGFGRV